MTTGTVQWFNATKGFGYIIPDDGTFDVFVDVCSTVGHRELTEGQRVTFDAESGAKGRQATRVAVLSEARRAPPRGCAAVPVRHWVAP